jgi:hypothetical protein
MHHTLFGHTPFAAKLALHSKHARLAVLFASSNNQYQPAAMREANIRGDT